MHHHQAINALTALPHLLAGGCETKLDLEHCVPDFLVFTAIVVLQFPDLHLILGLADTKPVVTIIRATECSVGISQLLVPLISRERRALDRLHDVRCLVHDEAQHPRLSLVLDALSCQVAQVQDCDIKDI